MKSLPRTRQGTRSATTKAQSRALTQESLTRAFLTFTQAADSLEKSYTQLQGEVSRLHIELQRTNSELEHSLEENTRVRGYLSRILENLPCGVLVINAAGETQIINPEARRLLQVPADWAPRAGNALPGAFEKLIHGTCGSGSISELEWGATGSPANRSIGILRANVSEAGDNSNDTIWIVRDTTEEKRLASEREAARRSLALAEVATVLAHEIRNPLGSMELFTGLLADATAQMPETRQWVNHLQAGLRALSATMTNVVDVYINYLRRKVDSGYDRALIRTIRGVGYQIGGNGRRH